MRQEVHFGRELVLAGTILVLPALVPVQHRPLTTPSWARLAFLCVRVTLSILLNLTMLTTGRRRLTTGSISMGQYLGRRIRLRGSQQQPQQQRDSSIMPPAIRRARVPPARKSRPQRNSKHFLVVMICRKSQRRQTDFCDQSISVHYTKDLAEGQVCRTIRMSRSWGNWNSGFA